MDDESVNSGEEIQNQLLNETNPATENIATKQHPYRRYLNKKTIASCCVIIPLAVVAVVAAVVAVFHNTNSKGSSTADLKEPTYALQQQEVICSADYKIDTNTKCTSSQCSKCKTKIPGPVPVKQYMVCETKGRQPMSLTNFTKYLQEVTNGDDSEEVQHCCQYIDLCPSKEYCNGGGAVCHRSTLNCTCLPGKNGPRCLETYVEEIQCSCYSNCNTFGAEETLPNCTDTNRPLNWTKCLLERKTETQEDTCICTKAIDKNLDTLDCFKPVTGKVISSSIATVCRSLPYLHILMPVCLCWYYVHFW